MLLFRGFKTLEAAKAFSKDKDGKISWINQPELKPHNHNKDSYLYAVSYGLNEKIYPFCVTYHV